MPSVDFDRLLPRDFDKLARFIQDYSGIKMPSNKMTMVEGRLRRRVRDGGFADFAAYCRYLFDEDGLEKETVHLIDAVTTNKTEFFREPEHFRLLDELVLPAVLESSGGRTPLKLWSAACSSGAEPYTLAMVVAEFANRIGGVRGTILATDICTEVLATAIDAIYPEAAIAPVPAMLRQRYLLRGKRGADARVRISPQLRAMVRFGRLNLMAARYGVDHDHDVIFCRNILIYFDRPTQEAVLRRLCDHLRPGGFLFLGHSETLAGHDLPVESVCATLYRRI